MKKIFLKIPAYVLIIPALMLAACSDSTTSPNQDDPPHEEPPLIVEMTKVTLDNAGAQAYLVTDIDGDAASAELETSNTDITLIIGARFVFENGGGASNHPLDFRNTSGQKLLGQSNAAGSFDDDEDVGVLYVDDSIEFTLTEELAGALANYVCSFHPGMGADFILEAE